MYVKNFNELNESKHDIGYYLLKFKEIHGEKYSYPNGV
jgi:hypothetical protein